MSFDESLAARIREIFAGERDIAEKKMFGGLAFLVRGNMCAGVVGDELMLRIGDAHYDDALKRPHARPMDLTGKPMRGMIFVAAEGIAGDAALGDWLAEALAFARTLPPKAPKRIGPARRVAATRSRAR